MHMKGSRLNKPSAPRALAKKSTQFLVEFLGKLVLTLAALVGLGMALMYPIQRDYYRRVYAQESLKHARLLASTIQDYHQANQRNPKSLDDLRDLPERPIEVQALAFDRQTGVIRVHVANAPSEANAFELVPSIDAAGRVTHACRSVNIPDAFVPQDCAKAGTQ